MSIRLLSESHPGQSNGAGVLDYSLEKDSGYWDRCGKEQDQCQELSEGQMLGVKIRLRTRDHLRTHQSQSR